jgi:hypothetical protein
MVEELPAEQREAVRAHVLEDRDHRTQDPSRNSNHG